MGYVARAAANPGTVIFADVRGKRIPVEVSALPFIKPHYKRDL
jgi:aminomethyltransferase